MYLTRLVAPIFLCIVLTLIPSYVLVGQGQEPMNPLPIETYQCMDFNQDKTCEFILLTNGTKIANPLEPDPTKETSQAAQTTNFLSYENPALGIRMQYPGGWQLEQDNDKTRFIQQKDIVSLETDVGEPCKDTEKEDSTLDDETEYVDETGEEENDEGEEEESSEDSGDEEVPPFG